MTRDDHGGTRWLDGAVRLKWRAVHTVRGWFACRHCGGSRIEETYAGYGTVREFPCGYCKDTGRRLIRDTVGVSLVEAGTFVITSATWTVRQLDAVHTVAWFIVVALIAFTVGVLVL